MRAFPLLLLIPLVLSGCYFSYSEGGESDGWDDDDWASWGDEDTDAALDDETPDDNPLADAFWFEPDQISLGDMQIIELHADPDLCAAVVSIDIQCDVTVHAVETVGDEIRIAVTVDAGAELGPVHVVIELEDGTTVFLEDALEVLPEGEATTPAECP